MKSLLILRRVSVENANAISGITYGFPAMTHFLGFTHALSRMMQSQFEHLCLKRCCVIAHSHQVKSQQPKAWGDQVFALTRNPLTKEGKTAPFNEEGKMHLEVSLIIEIEGFLDRDDDVDVPEFIAEKLPLLRLAGGSVISWRGIDIQDDCQDEKSARRLLFSLLPGYTLIDRSELLWSHHQALMEENPQASMLDAFLDFCTLQYRPVVDSETNEQPTESTKAKWEYKPKPAAGYLVPIMTGYKGISPLYPAGEVANARDPNTPFQFVESVYGIGEWISLNKFITLDPLFWQYQPRDDWYLCTQKIISNEA
ncbi:type I-F CRISPR-associated protein Csy2 [Gynuella sunshinyii]|uniref:CRISPR-associated protein, Csy2 family n=1 Tax=Gynuella sunshinyii YC6258 TaxID=1445510 RepID=A0A0C5VS34_9GAMM|nr:type I-F CRISPR-associated protein Csy2 [Gynuella sunshinyii]AJQ97036.1 hypothetical Protein YC6258_05004 [Gynuella sunshinyii YC6258]